MGLRSVADHVIMKYHGYKYTIQYMIYYVLHLREGKLAYPALKGIDSVNTPLPELPDMNQTSALDTQKSFDIEGEVIDLDLQDSVEKTALVRSYPLQPGSVRYVLDASDQVSRARHCYSIANRRSDAFTYVSVGALLPAQA